MYEAGRFLVIDDPLGRPGQERLIGEVPSSRRLIVFAVEWRDSGETWQRRPISSWEARPHEAAVWQEEFADD